LIHGPSRTEALVSAINHVLVTDGIPGLSMRRIAAVSGVSTGSMTHHYGGRARLIGLAASRTARALHADIDARRYGEGVCAFLPCDDDGVLLHRAWLAWLELGRCETDVEPVVTRARTEELSLLADTVEHRHARDGLDLLSAVVAGLRAEVCAPLRPMPPERAAALLRAHAAAPTVS
jgi:AcrR family transcriptional regulator